MKNENSLTSGPLVPTLIYFTLPFFFASMLQNLYGTIDTIVIGKFGSTAGVSAVSCGAQLLALFTQLAIGLSTGGTVLMGHAIGSKNDERARKIVGNLIIDFAVVAFVLMVVALLFSSTFLKLLNVPAEAIGLSQQYMRICSFGIPFMIGYNIVCALLRAMGDSKSPLLFVAVACGVNIVGDLLFTGLLKMSASGVALATVLGQSVSFIFALKFILNKGFSFDFRREDIHFDMETSLDIFNVGVPMGIQSILVNLSFMFITAIINNMGLTASAAMGIGDKIVNFAFMPQTSFSAALAVIVAQNYGARQNERAVEAVKIAIVIGLVIESMFAAVCWLAPTVLPAIFSKDPEVIAMSGLYMKAYSMDAVLTAISFNLSGFCNGVGKTKFNMTQNLISTFLGRVPVTYFLSRLANTNLFLIGLAAPASTVLSIVMLGLFIRFGDWNRNIYA